MKRLILYFCIISALTMPARAQQDFESSYKSTEYVNEYYSKLYHTAVTPVWRGNDTFYYTTRGKEGYEYYKISISERSKTAVPEDSVRGASAPAGVIPQMGRWPGRGQAGLSPDGKWECLLQDNNVWVRNVESKVLTQLSFDGTDKDRYIQYQWSPDSRHISALRKQEHDYRQVGLRNSHPETQVQPEYRWLDYDKPGDALPQSTVALFDVESLRQVTFDTSAWTNQYDLFLGQWSPDSRFFTFEYNQRGHQLYQLVAVDAESGACLTLAQERSEAFVYYNDLYRHYFKDGSRILWISERDDWRHLYSINPAVGSMTQLTKGEWNVREILHVDEENSIVLMYANGYASGRNGRAEDPYNKHLLRLEIQTGKLNDLTPENGFHQVTFNSDYSAFVDSWSRPDLTPESVVRSASDGKILVRLEKTDASELMATGYTLPEVFVAKGRDGKTDIWGNIYRPANFDPKKKYPVVEYIYAGPHDSHVDKEFVVVPRFMRLVEMGFIVVTIDGMGTDNRSKSFQDVAFRNLKDAGFPDRELWIKAAVKKYPYMDISNLGIYGYSAGGQNALGALLFFGDFYKVAVSLCGCHDNRMDKIWWNEQWMGYPVGPWYSENSNVDNAWRLEGKLLLVNGELDDNVDPASTLQVVSELIKHDKDFEQLYLPGHSHNLGSEYITKRIYRFFWDNCR